MNRRSANRLHRTVAALAAAAILAAAPSVTAQTAAAPPPPTAGAPIPTVGQAPNAASPYPAPAPAGYPPAAAPPPGYPVTTVVETPAAPPAVVERNSADEAKDSGLGLEWFWANADVGASYIDLASVNSSNFALQRSSSSGPALGLDAGVRLLFLALGLRARDLQLAAFNLWELDVDVAFHTRIDRIDPYIALRGGYAFVGRLSSSTVASINGSSPDVSIRGGNGGMALGCDYYFNHFVSLGLDLNPELVFLQRPKATLPSNFNLLPSQAQAAILASPIYQASGSSVGFGFTGTAHLGFHL